MSLSVNIRYGFLKAQSKAHPRPIKAKCEFDVGITAIVGPSGSGKSTFAHLLAGLLTPTAGTITYNDKAYFDHAKKINRPPQTRAIGYVFQDNALFPHLTVRENILFSDPAQTINVFLPIIKAFEIDHLLDRFPQTISGGEAKRTAIVRALAAEPEILILDEALTGLDKAKKNVLIDYLKLLKQHFDGPILMMTHQIEDVFKLADMVSIIDQDGIKPPQPIDHIIHDKDFKNHFQLNDNINFLHGKISEKSDDGICHISIAGHSFKSYQKNAEKGQTVRLYIEPKDISIALSPPTDTSILNIVAAKVQSISQNESGIAYVTLSFEADNEDTIPLTLNAAITRQSLTHLNLQKGQDVFALIKALSVLG